MCDFNIAFRDGENPFERGARTASKTFFRNPRLSGGFPPFKMHQYKIHSRGTRLIRRIFLRWSILPPSSRHTAINRSLPIPSNINISMLGYALLKSIFAKKQFRLLCFISSTRREIKRLNIRVICNFIGHTDANISLAKSFSFSLLSLPAPPSPSSLPFERGLRQLEILQYLHNGTQWCIVTFFFRCDTTITRVS